MLQSACLIVQSQKMSDKRSGCVFSAIMMDCGYVPAHSKTLRNGKIQNQGSADCASVSVYVKVNWTCRPRCNAQ